MSVLNKCRHYSYARGEGPTCAVGVDIMKRADNTRRGLILRMPCITGMDRKGETPFECSQCSPPTAEEREAEEREWQAHFAKVMPFLREIKEASEPGDRGQRPCPKCGNTVHWQRARINGHLHAMCETDDCLSVME